MPINYDGKPSSATTYPTLNIVSTTNANPITVTVSGSLPANFAISALGGGMLPKVHISGHVGNFAANGIFVATPTGTSTFTIPVAGIAVGGATGIVQPLGYGPVYAVPSDGDGDDQASITSWAESTGDRTQALAANVGQFKLARREIIFTTSGLVSPQPPWAQWASGGLTAGTPVQFTAQTVTWNTAIGSALGTPVGGQGPTFGLSGMVAGDLVTVRLTTTYESPAQHAVALYAAQMNSTITPTWPSGYAHLSGASVAANAAATGNNGTTPMTLEGFLIASLSGDLWIQPILFPLTTGTSALQLQGDAILTIDFWRGTGVPQ